MPEEDLSPVRRPTGDNVIMVVVDTDKDHGEKAPRRGSTHTFQYFPSLAEDNHRP